MTTESQPDSVEPEHAEPSPWSPPTSELQPSEPEKAVVLSHPWGPWSTIGWTALCILVGFVAQVAGLAIMLVLRNLTSGNTRIDDLVTDGNVLAVSTLLSTITTLGLVSILIWIRQYPFRKYLALRWPPARTVWTSFVGLAVLLVATDLTTYLLGKPIVPPFTVDIYRHSWLPVLLFTLVVLAPLSEEPLFRGFLYAGLAASRAGPRVAIVISSIWFALLHIQYDWFGLVAVAATGFYLGVVRFWSRSLFLTMVLHAIANTVATLEVVVHEHWFT